MKRIALVLSILAPLLLGSCASSFKATFDHDPSQNFGSYKEFTWIDSKPLMAAGNLAINPLLEGRLMRATRQALESKGYRFVNNHATADFVVSFTVGARDKIRVTSYPSGYGAGHRGWGWGGGYYGTHVDTKQYTEGVLAIDLFDVRTKRPVWHGVASKSITKSDRENADETVRAAVAAIMNGFPPS